MSTTKTPWSIESEGRGGGWYLVAYTTSLSAAKAIERDWKAKVRITYLPTGTVHRERDS